MPTEFRHIIFSRDELLEAIKGYRKRRRDPLPPGSILNYSIEEEPNLHVLLRVAPDRSDEPVQLVFEKDELVNALIMFCIDQSIPMPIESAKFLQLFGKSVGLVITKNVSAARDEVVVE